MCNIQKFHAVKKLLIIGNTYAKNYLLYTYDRGVFIPQIDLEWCPTQISVQLEDQITMELRVANPCFKPQYQRLRPLAYNNSDIILACFAIDYPESLEYIRDKFWKEASVYCPDTPIVLVGLKSDLREEIRKRKQELVSFEDALKVAGQIGAVDYFECSPKTMFNVNELFETLAQLALQNKQKKKKKTQRFCSIV